MVKKTKKGKKKESKAKTSKGKERQKEFNEMTKKERKNFLDADFINRMIRVEQHISKTFGEEVNYNETDVYNDLKDKERKNYENWLKKQKKIKGKLLLLLGTPVLLFFLSLNFQMTGNVVGGGEGITLTLLQSIILILTVFVFTIIGIIFLFKKRKNKKLDGHLSVIHDWLSNAK